MERSMQAFSETNTDTNEIREELETARSLGNNFVTRVIGFGKDEFISHDGTPPYQSIDPGVGQIQGDTYLLLDDGRVAQILED